MCSAAIMSRGELDKLQKILALCQLYGPALILCIVQFFTIYVHLFWERSNMSWKHIFSRQIYTINGVRVDKALKPWDSRASRAYITEGIVKNITWKFQRKNVRVSFRIHDNLCFYFISKDFN